MCKYGFVRKKISLNFFLLCNIWVKGTYRQRTDTMVYIHSGDINMHSTFCKHCLKITHMIYKIPKIITIQFSL